MFDVSVASPVKTIFKRELDTQINRIAHADPEEQKKTQMMRRVRVESFLNALRRGATRGKIGSGFRATGLIPFNPQILIDSACAICPGIFQTQGTGTETKEMILTSPEGLGFLWRHKHGREISVDNHRMEPR
jgi:hypothetical protein